MRAISEISLPFLRAVPGLPQLQEYLLSLDGTDQNIFFLCYDIKSLRNINRVYGRRVGDALLSAVAMWTQCFQKGKLYRIGGDEFCIVFINTGLEYLQSCANKMESRFGRVWHLELEDGSLDLFTQAAIAVVDAIDCNYKTELPDLLEQALELSRKSHQSMVFTAEYERIIRGQMQLHMELKNCILSNMLGFSVAYQPLVDPVTNCWRGLEALCRWTGPTIGSVPPNIFIVETEEMGLIHELGCWVLDTSLGHCKAMQLDELDRFFLSVNVSASQVNRRDFVDTVLALLKKHQYPGNKLMLEITESTQFLFNEVTTSAITTLRANGILLALDDFGTGYSGFANLKNLPVDMLKTDKEFLEDIEDDTYLQYFYYIMSETVHSNNMLLIAEGVETPEQLRSVVKNGADLIQGYLFGRPMDRECIEENIINFTRELHQFTIKMNDQIDFKHWIRSQNAYKITPALFGLQSKCISTVLDEENFNDAIQKTLEITGMHFKVNRSYVFLRDERPGTFFSNRYEWCAEGILPQKHLFQGMDGSQDGFYDVLRENEVVIARNSTQLPTNLRERLTAGGQQETVQSIVVMPMKQHGEIVGFVGFSDSAKRDWMPEELIILHNLCLFCIIILAKATSWE